MSFLKGSMRRWILGVVAPAAMVILIVSIRLLLIYTDPEPMPTVTRPTPAMAIATSTTAMPAPPSTPRVKPYFDPYLTRADEHFISIEDFLDCLDKRLRVDHRTQQEFPFEDVNRTIPYLVMPVTLEQGDMKAFMCNLSVSIQHLTYVQNGGLGSMTAFLDLVQNAFVFTTRIHIPRLPHNFGYATALNVAMRHALSMPAKEVPFFVMGNNDVRFEKGVWETALPVTYERSLAGLGRLAELAAEVASEPNEHTPERFRAVPVRSTDGHHVLTTSRLLPDRIRYQPREERLKSFNGYYGELTFHPVVGTAFWGLSRLALETVGFFDENCYPAYYEDTDYGRRLRLLGFEYSWVPATQHLYGRHIGGGTVLGVRSFKPAPELVDVLPFIRGSKFVMEQSFSHRYTIYKYNLSDGNWPDKAMSDPAVAGGFPLDAVVLDVERQRAITRLQELSIEFQTNREEFRKQNIFSPMQLFRKREPELKGKLAPFNPPSADYYRDGAALRLLQS